MSDDNPGINDDPMAAERQDKLDEFVRRGQAAQKAADKQGVGRIERDSEWTCGHVATAMCAECYANLAARANALAEENARLRDDAAPDEAVRDALNKMLLDVTYRTPELGKPLAQIVITRAHAEALLAWAATRWPR